MISGYVLKRSNTDYVIGCDSQGQGGYNVVSKTVDPHNAYTIAEVEAYLIEHPEMLLNSTALDLEQKKTEAKAQRDTLISAVEWRRSRYRDEVALGLPPTESLLPILRYIQALRDITKQTGYPANVVWPTLPSS